MIINAYNDREKFSWKKSYIEKLVGTTYIYME